MTAVAKSPAPFRYLNPWSADPVSNPEYFESYAQPIDYRGFQIVRRFPKSHELVKDGVCLTQRAGGGALKSLVDALLGDKSDHPKWLVERARDIAKRHGVSLTTTARTAAKAVA